MLEAEARGEERGRAEGEKRGRAEGEKRGRAEGRAEGEKRGRFDIAKNMIDLGLETDVIVKSTGLSEEQIKKLKE
jgi:predicted transposase YdaD